MNLTARSCRIFYHDHWDWCRARRVDDHLFCGTTNPIANASSSGSRACCGWPFDSHLTRRHEKVEVVNRPVAPGWPSDQYAVELWLQRSLLHHRHAWSVRRPDDADLIFGAMNFSLFCLNGHFYLYRAVWSHLLAAFGNFPTAAHAVTLQYGQCPAPWKVTYGDKRERDRSNTVVLLDRRSGSTSVTANGNNSTSDERAQAVISPFVVADPPWLVAEQPEEEPSFPLPRTPWASRKLLFFAGHVPKLYVSRTRYRLWSALRPYAESFVAASGPAAAAASAGNLSVTLVSSTLRCSVGAFATPCRMDPRELQSQNNSFFGTFCHADCGVDDTCGATPKAPPGDNAARLLRKCKAYAHVRYDRELEDMRRTTRTLSHEAYMAASMSHRFCLVAPGDFTSTKKLSETMAVGGVGGCIPLIVLPGTATHKSASTAAARLLPYGRWLDYCGAAFFVTEYHATYRMPDVLRELANVDAQTAAKKHAALAHVRDAFVFREGSSVERPSAAEYVLAEMCEAARLGLRSARSDEATDLKRSPLLVDGVPRRCLVASAVPVSAAHRM